jgi:hypothetical protein
VKTYGIERGDVLLSLQCTVANESMDGGWLPTSWRSTPARTDSQTPTWGPWNRDDHAEGDVHLHPTVPVARPLLTVQIVEPMVDPETGAGTGLALRRDVNRDVALGSSGGAPFLLLRVRVLPEPGGEDPPSAAGLEAVRYLCEIGPFVLRGRDRMYRTGPVEVTLLLGDTDLRGAEAVWSRLESTMQRAMLDRGQPAVRLDAEIMEVAALLDGTSAVVGGVPAGRWRG